MIQIDLTGIRGLSLDFEETTRSLTIAMNVREGTIQLILSPGNNTIGDMLLDLFQAWNKIDVKPSS